MQVIADRELADPLGSQPTLSRWALLAGWLWGMAWGTWMVGARGFNSTIYPLHLGSLIVPGYAALYSVIGNFAITVVLTMALRLVNTPAGVDATAASDYMHDVEDLAAADQPT